MVLENQDASGNSSEARIREDFPFRTLDIDLHQVCRRQVREDVPRGNFDRAASITRRLRFRESVRKAKRSPISGGRASRDHPPTLVKPVRANRALEQRAVVRVGLERNKLTVGVATEEKRAEKAHVRAEINTDWWTSQFCECRCRPSR